MFFMGVRGAVRLIRVQFSQYRIGNESDAVGTVFPRPEADIDPNHSDEIPKKAEKPSLRGASLRATRQSRRHISFLSTRLPRPISSLRRLRLEILLAMTVGAKAVLRELRPFEGVQICEYRKLCDM